VKWPSIPLTKFEAAERQLHQAIILFFASGDSVSVHTLCEAASQIFYDIGKAEGIGSILRDSDWIKDEYKKEFHALLFKAKNFFKHADRDKSQVLEFVESLNHFSLFDASSMAIKLKNGLSPETRVFITWLALKYPKIIKRDSEFSKFISSSLSGLSPINPNELDQFLQVIHATRSGNFALPNTLLYLGRLKPLDSNG